MSSRRKPHGNKNPRPSKAEAVNRIHEMALEAFQIAKKAELYFLVYLLGMVVEHVKPIAGTLIEDQVNELRER